MEAIIRDTRYAIRSLLKTPGFLLVAVLTLGLGIGANTAIFSLLDQVMLRSLPGVTRPTELVLLDGPGAFRGRAFNNATLSHPMYRDFRAKNDVFAGVVADFPTSLTVTWQGAAERVTGELVSGNFFSVLGVRAAAGRVFNDQDDTTPLGHSVVVLSHGFWTRRFGASHGVIGQTLGVNGHPMTIVGVTSADFRGIELGRGPDVYAPVMMKAWMTPTWNDLDVRTSKWLTVMARLKPGVTRERALSAMNVIYKQINERELAELPGDVSATFRDRFRVKQLVLHPASRGRAVLDREIGAPLFVLMGMVGLVLLIACANVANLLLARAAARYRETSVRLALGANRGQLLRQSFIESLVLAIAGGGVGLLFGLFAGRLIIGGMPSDAGFALSPDPEPRMLVFTLVASILTAFVAGLGPALSASRPALAGTMKDEGGNVLGGGRQMWVRKILVATQIALSMLLLVGAALFTRTLLNLRSTDPGFDVTNTLTFAMDPGLTGYAPEKVRLSYEQLRERLSAIPGVASASLAEVMVLDGSSWRSTVRVDGYSSKEGEDMNPDVNGVAPAFFKTLGIPLLRGRDFTPADVLGAEKVAIVNETFVKYFFAGRDPIGGRLSMGRASADWVKIVGVVKDTRAHGLRDVPVRFLYLPAYQGEELGGATFYLKASSSAPALAASVRETVRQADPSVPLYDMRTLEEQLNRSVIRERMVATLSAAFGVLATLMAAIGLYGVMSYAIARRTREIGLRMALGAAPARVLGMIMREILGLSAAGIVVGVAAAFYLTKYLAQLLFGLAPRDVTTFALSAAFLLLVALLAGLLPAHRATRIDPTVALRTE